LEKEGLMYVYYLYLQLRAGVCTGDQEEKDMQIDERRKTSGAR
jgi:hypothetical protein